jgi:hypothetical protein
MAEAHVCETHKEVAKTSETKELALVAGPAKAAMTEEERLAKMAAAARVLLECMGEDPTRAGLLDTPMRMAKALSFFTQGYRQQLSEVVGRGIFDESEDCDGMVLMRDIEGAFVLSVVAVIERLLTAPLQCGPCASITRVRDCC